MEEQKRILKVRIVNLDDWMGFYVDGRLRYDNHSIDDDHLLRILQEETAVPASIDFKSFWADGILDEFGNQCPPNWDDLKIYDGWVD